MCELHYSTPLCLQKNFEITFFTISQKSCAVCHFEGKKSSDSSLLTQNGAIKVKKVQMLSEKSINSCIYTISLQKADGDFEC